MLAFIIGFILGGVFMLMFLSVLITANNKYDEVVLLKELWSKYRTGNVDIDEVDRHIRGL